MAENKLVLSICCLLLVTAGCGGVESGVATGPEETAPAQTEEVLANEAEAARSAASQENQ